MPGSAEQLEFETHQFTDVREGYVTLDWNKVDSAAFYSVTDKDSTEVFHGTFPQAFISGLPDGDHRFNVAAFDGKGELIASSTTAATVSVQHWSLGLAMSLFGCGLIVLLAVIGVLIWGTRNEVPQSGTAP